MRTHSLAVAACLVALAAGAWAQELPSGHGVATPSGSTFTTAITPAGDVDDYAFKGFPGMSVTVVVKATKPVAPAAALVPVVQFVRPDGVVADDDMGFTVSVKGLTTTAKVTLNAPGYWQARVRGLDGTSTGGYSIHVVYRPAPTRPTLPFATKSFTTKGAVVSTRSDTDDYYFEGYSGQTISATVTKPKSSALFPGLQLFRPDGSEVAGGVAFNNKSASVATTATSAQQGTWRVRVYGIDTSDHPDPKSPQNTTGAYTLAVKLGKLPVAPSLKPDVNGQYRFTIPAVGGATIGYTLSFKGAAPVFNSFVNPTGGTVPGFLTGLLKYPSFKIPEQQPFGFYTLTFDAPSPAPTNVTFASKVTAPKADKPVKLTLSSLEPIILVDGVSPSTAGSLNETPLIVRTGGNLVDPSVDDETKVVLLVDHTPLKDISVLGTTVRGTLTAGFAEGFHDVVVRTSSGQVAVAANALEVVPPPSPEDIDPTVGSIAGNYPVTITGHGFSKLGDPQIVIGAVLSTAIVPVHINSVTDTKIEFLAPMYGTTGKITFGVIDARNSNGKLLQPNSFEFVGSPAISRLVPGLTTILGGDLISINGANFAATDHVYIQKTPTSPDYDELFNTFVSTTMHQFPSPVRTPGQYNVYVTDQFGQPQPPRTRKLTYFQFADLSTTTAGMFPSGADVWDGSSVAVADFDKDGIDDLILSRAGGTLNSSSNTRVLKNDGLGHFSDVTATTMPPATSTDDWRADRVWTSDVNLDGYADILLVSNDNSVLPGGRSHVRILINEAQSGGTPTGRVFRDRTTSLFPGPRGGGYDNWRGLDMWVGDIDKGAATAPPEILIVHKDTKQELDVTCSPYCASPFAGGYTYGFYWGGARAFFWDKNLNGGLGKYKFERNFFPRKGGLRVPVGMSIPICNGQQYGQPCVDRFTPFLGKRIAAGDLDGDGKPDIAVVSDDVVRRIYPPSTALVTISSLQVGMNKFNTADGAEITDVTAQLTAIGGDFKGDAVEIAPIGFPDGNAFGTIAVAKSSDAGVGGAMRLLKFRPGTLPASPFDFDDITSQSLPSTASGDAWQASKILFKDVDADGDQDMLIICPTPPGGTGPAFRILRNDIVGQTAGVFTTSLMPLLQGTYLPLGSNEHYEGDTMAIADVNRDGAYDFVLVRANASQPSPETRVLITDKTGH